MPSSSKKFYSSDYCLSLTQHSQSDSSKSVILIEKSHLSQVFCLVRLLPQIIFDTIGDTNNMYWKWFLKIRHFLCFVSMPELTDSQVSGQPNAHFCQFSKSIWDTCGKTGPNFRAIMAKLTPIFGLIRLFGASGLKNGMDMAYPSVCRFKSQPY